MLAAEGIRDEWAVLAKTQEEDANLQIERIWLYGIQSQRFALILNFYAAGQLPQHLLVPGCIVPSEICFFPAVWPLRGLIKSQEPIRGKIAQLNVEGTVAAAFISIAEILSANPFVDRIPLMISNVRLSQQGEQWFATDKNEDGMPIRNSGLEQWTLLAVTRGEQFSCFGIFESGSLDIHAIWSHDTFHSLK